MVSLWWGQTALDELIEKATSELLPANQEDVALQFMISDQIRSKKVNAKDAMRSLHRRLQHKNPNVQMATLSLTDTCVKNGGDQFVREIASREFMEGISTLVHSSNTDHNVRQRTLSILQTWAIAAKNTPSLSYLTDTYNLFRAEGVSFPEVQEPVNSFLLETIAPPEWTDSDVCERCRTPFTLTNRKHHCRNCGGTFCQECSSKSLPLPHMAIDEAVRVCYGCYIKLKLSRVAKKEGPLPPYPGAPQQLQQQQHQHSSAVTSSVARAPAAQPITTTTTTTQQNDEDKQFEEDLQKALALSKKEAEQSGYGTEYIPSYNMGVTGGSNKTSEWEQPTTISAMNNHNDQQQQQEGEDDPELAAAIAASLKDMEDAQKSTFEYYSNQKATSTTFIQHRDELSPIDMENIELFALLIQRMNANGKTIANDDDQINGLYTQIGALQPKLVKNLDEASQKHQKFAELHEKLNMAVKVYDQLLQQRVANSYYNRGPSLSTTTQGHTQYPTSAMPPTSPTQQQQPQQNSLYPTMQPPSSNVTYPSTVAYPQQPFPQNGGPSAAPPSSIASHPYQHEPQQPQQQQYNYGSPAPNHQQSTIQTSLPPPQPQYHYGTQPTQQQPYPQIPQQQQQQSIYPSVPTNIPTPPSSQSQPQTKPIEEAPLIDL
ncbi:hypothetical protein BDA99DRAFT_491836 [Phascolomyces articulosus]|uniref:Vacuolar protein sorting-associated protein 27 n=1 Tax=Phascolomyces articulosus TaxID=60185 RepID=A0AAD5KQT5_9FUNG|nr:hypothetical protein BDA99DRAFT_491836 [Phascolomyces articulosus]